jgi:hypothetical protein
VESQIDEIDKNFQEIPEKGEIDEMQSKSNIDLEITGIHWLINNNDGIPDDKARALKLVKHALNWVVGNSQLTPFEIAEVFINESP